MIQVARSSRSAGPLRKGRLDFVCLTALLSGLVFAAPAEAYIGPGAGFAVLSSFLLLAISFALAICSLLVWPFRVLVRALTRRRTPRPGSVDRVVILGLDGLDPGLAEQYMAEGKLPNFQRVKEEGTFARLATSYPSISPAAWSSFMTGVDCSHHNICDFLTRDPRTYLPVLSSAEIGGPARVLSLGKFKIPLGKPRVRLLRRSRPFWAILGEHGIFSSIIRVPITFPPERFNGVLLSGMCTPDLKGTQGTFSYYTTKNGTGGDREGGTCIPVTRRGDVIQTFLYGPNGAGRRAGTPLRVPLTIRLDAARNRIQLRVCGQRLRLEPHAYSPWVRVRFRGGLLSTVHGICRFYLNRLAPDFELYATPAQIDPERPALPISHPFAYSVYLAKLIKPYGTLGLAESAVNIMALLGRAEDAPSAAAAGDPAGHEPEWVTIWSFLPLPDTAG